MTNTTHTTDLQNLAADLRLQAIKAEADRMRRLGVNSESAAYMEGVAQGLRNAAVRITELASVFEMEADVAERKVEDREYYAAKAVAAGVR